MLLCTCLPHYVLFDIVFDQLPVWVCVRSMGVRVMDTSWVSRKGSATLARKTSSTPPGMPGSGPGDALIPEQPGELGASPLGTPPPAERLW